MPWRPSGVSRRSRGAAYSFERMGAASPKVMKVKPFFDFSHRPAKLWDKHEKGQKTRKKARPQDRLETNT